MSSEEAHEGGSSSGTSPPIGLKRDRKRRQRQQNKKRRRRSTERKTPAAVNRRNNNEDVEDGDRHDNRMTSHSDADIIERRKHGREQKGKQEETRSSPQSELFLASEVTTQTRRHDETATLRMVSAANDASTEARDNSIEAEDEAEEDEDDTPENQLLLVDGIQDQKQLPLKLKQPPVKGARSGATAGQVPTEQERKGSQSSTVSRASTSAFGCLLASSASDGDRGSNSRRSSSICAGLDQQPNHKQWSPGKGARRFLMEKLARKSSSIVDCFQLEQRRLMKEQRLQNGDIQQCPPDGNSHKTATSMVRTISQSMLELDESCISPSDNFEIIWRDLVFAYEPRSWLARATAWLSSSLRLSASGSQSNLVLKNISGGFRSNQLVAIIGPSGCGKTTLLQFLAGNSCAQRDKLLIRGLDELKVAYIGQDDSLLPGLTVRETLMYASLLQNSRKGFDHAQHIKPILSELGLLECAERSVSKLSGGQAKRVTIAQDLLCPTNLLILDEVTSGLDASTSYSIVKLLKYLVSDHRYPMSIVISIHQPSARLFSVFDQVYVMSEGYCLYEGSCELAQINEHLAKFGLACPPYHNIADYLIELACCTTADESELPPPPSPGVCNGKGNYAGAGQHWFVSGGGANNSDEAKKIVESTAASHTVRDHMVEYQRKLQESRESFGRESHERQDATTMDNSTDSSDKTNSISSLYLAIERARRRRLRPFCNHFRIHLRRSLLRIRRSYILTYLQLITYIVLGLQLATFYGPDIGRLSGCPRLPANLMSYVLASNSDNSEQQEDDLALEVRRIQENMNFLLVAVMTATFAALEITVITFPLEAKTVKREWRDGWYRVSSYFFGRTLADLPFQLAFVMIFCLLIYILTDQIGLYSWRFPVFVATIVMTALIAQSFGFIFGAMFMDNLPAAVFTAPLAIFPTLLFSGFFSRVSQIPVFYKPLTYLSHFRYTFDALLVILYGYDRCKCDQATLSQYHSGMRNQTSSMREMFTYLFGAADCVPPGALSASTGNAPPGPGTTSADEYLAAADSGASISHDDLTAIQSGNSTLAAQVLRTILENANTTGAALTIQAPPPTTPSFIKPLEDAFVDGIFEQMTHKNSTSAVDHMMTNDSGDAGDQTVMDRLAARFSTRLTTLLNKQSNFGHQMPTDCRQFNSYLLTEFDLHDEDLLFGLVMLFIVVILTRLMCNCLLNFTIATRIK